MITRKKGFAPTYPVYGSPAGPSPTLVPGGVAYWTVPPAGQIMARSGKASWDPQAGPAYGIARTSAPMFSLGTPKIAMDPSDPSTWQRSYVFTP